MNHVYLFGIIKVNMSAKSKRHIYNKPLYKRKWLLVSGTILLVVFGIVTAFRLSPWPGALVIRTVFNHGGSKTLAAMKATLPEYPVTMLKDQVYRPNDKAARLDIYIPKTIQPGQNLPVVIWTHGGAWLSGDKKDGGPYFSRLAHEGFIVVAPNYSLSPGKTYPTAVHELNDSYGYVLANASRLHIDSQKIFLAGDSAGAQLTSQLAAITTDPDYAREVGVRPALKPQQLAGVLLFCGIYKMEVLATPDPTLPKIVGWGDDVAVWAYTGTRNRSSPLLHQMSAYYHATKTFPAAFITGGNGDPLTSAQSQPFADKLASLGVDVTRLFYAKNHIPSLPHEYQFTFNSDGENAFVQTVHFLQAKS